jgi:hypothetical protein
VIIFDEYQKRETVDLKTRVTLNVFSDRNPRKRSQKDPIAVAPTPNHNKINLEKDYAANVKIFKR